MDKEICQLIKDKLAEYPELPSRTLARMIYGMNKDIFKDIETVRTKIRYYRGKTGNAARKKVLKSYGKYF